MFSGNSGLFFRKNREKLALSWEKTGEETAGLVVDGQSFELCQDSIRRRAVISCWRPRFLYTSIYIRANMRINRNRKWRYLCPHTALIAIHLTKKFVKKLKMIVMFIALRVGTEQPKTFELGEWALNY